MVECMKSLRGLRAGRTYEAWVRAATSVGEGPPSSVIACQTSALGIKVLKNNFVKVFFGSIFSLKRQKN